MPKEDKIVEKQFSKFDKDITGWMATHGMIILRVGLGIFFFLVQYLEIFWRLIKSDRRAYKNPIHFIDPNFFSFLGA